MYQSADRFNENSKKKMIFCKTMFFSPFLVLGRAESETTELLQKNNQNMTADSENVKIFGI